MSKRCRGQRIGATLRHPLVEARAAENLAMQFKGILDVAEAELGRWRPWKPRRGGVELHHSVDLPLGFGNADIEDERDEMLLRLAHLKGGIGRGAVGKDLELEPAITSIFHDFQNQMPLVSGMLIT